MRRAAVGAEVRFPLAAAAEVVAPAILSVPGATLRVMDTLSNISDTDYEIPLSEADQTALRPALLHDLGAMPFESGALISRSLWVIFIGEWGVWTRAVLPVDDRLDMPDRKSITGLCDLVGSLMRPSVCHDDEKAMIVLRRPGPTEISEADAYIFRLVRQAAIGRETAPWTFHVVGPDGIREVTEYEASQATAVESCSCRRKWPEPPGPGLAVLLLAHGPGASLCRYRLYGGLRLHAQICALSC